MNVSFRSSFHHSVIHPGSPWGAGDWRWDRPVIKGGPCQWLGGRSEHMPPPPGSDTGCVTTEEKRDTSPCSTTLYCTDSPLYKLNGNSRTLSIFYRQLQSMNKWSTFRRRYRTHHACFHWKAQHSKVGSFVCSWYKEEPFLKHCMRQQSEWKAGCICTRCSSLFGSLTWAWTGCGSHWAGLQADRCIEPLPRNHIPISTKIPLRIGTSHRHIACNITKHDYINVGGTLVSQTCPTEPTVPRLRENEGKAVWMVERWGPACQVCWWLTLGACWAPQPALHVVSMCPFGVTGLAATRDKMSASCAVPPWVMRSEAFRSCTRGQPFQSHTDDVAQTRKGRVAPSPVTSQGGCQRAMTSVTSAQTTHEGGVHSESITAFYWRWPTDIFTCFNIPTISI